MKCFRFVLKNIRFWILNGTDDTPHTHTRAMLTLASRGVSHGWYLNTSCSQARPPCWTILAVFFSYFLGQSQPNNEYHTRLWSWQCIFRGNAMRSEGQSRTVAQQVSVQDHCSVHGGSVGNTGVSAAPVSEVQTVWGKQNNCLLLESAV